MALTVPVMFGLLGMVSDVGWAYWRREAARTAAQAAAMAVVSSAGSATPTTQASTACPSTIDPAKPWQVGCAFATQNGFTNGVSNRTVSIQVGSGATGIPVSGVAPSKYFVSATVTEQIPTLFSAVLKQANLNVTARSTVGVYGSGGGGCIYVMDPTASKAMNMSGANLSSGCGIYINSSASNADNMNGGNLTLTNSSNLNIHGGLSWSGGIICGNVPPTVPGCVNQGAASFTTPFSGMTAPTVASSCLPNPNISGGNSNTISPGTYCGITVSGGNNIIFSSGIYVLKTGNLTVNGGNFATAVTNVMIYIPPTNPTGQINISGGNMHWSGITGSGADGFVFWVANSAAQVINGSNYTINGVMYMPNSALTYNGGNGSQQTVVADTLTVNGGNITSAASSSYFTGSGGGVNGAYIVE